MINHVLVLTEQAEQGITPEIDKGQCDFDKRNVFIEKYTMIYDVLYRYPPNMHLKDLYLN